MPWFQPWKSQHRNSRKLFNETQKFNLKTSKQQKDGHCAHCQSWNWSSKIPGTTQSSIDRWEDNRCQYIAIFQTRLPAGRFHDFKASLRKSCHKQHPNILPTRKCNSSLDLCKFLLGKTPQIHDYPTVGQASQLTERMVRIFNCSSFFSRVHASLCCCCSIPDPEIDLIQSFTRTRSFQRRPPLFQNKTTLIMNNPLKLSLQNSHVAPVPPWGAWFCGDSHPVVYPQRFARCPPYHQAWHQTNGLKWTKLDFFKRNTLTYTPIKSCGNKKARFMTFDVTTLILQTRHWASTGISSPVKRRNTSEINALPGQTKVQKWINMNQYCTSTMES